LTFAVLEKLGDHGVTPSALVKEKKERGEMGATQQFSRPLLPFSLCEKRSEDKGIVKPLTFSDPRHISVKQKSRHSRRE
jgi:hypothetical protein